MDAISCNFINSAAVLSGGKIVKSGSITASEAVVVSISASWDYGVITFAKNTNAALAYPVYFTPNMSMVYGSGLYTGSDSNYYEAIYILYAVSLSSFTVRGSVTIGYILFAYQ